jgi:uncharacterized membrane protein
MLGIPPIEIHPLVVHFPIALLLTSVILDFGAIIFRRWRLADAATWCLVLGVPSAAVAVLAGGISENAIVYNSSIDALLHEHKIFAGLSCLLFGLMLFVRLIWLLPAIIGGMGDILPGMKMTLNRWQNALRMQLPRLYTMELPPFAVAIYLAIGVAGAICLAWTGHLGGRLVYELNVAAPH